MLGLGSAIACSPIAAFSETGYVYYTIECKVADSERYKLGAVSASRYTLTVLDSERTETTLVEHPDG